jgi:hypothetical protein
VASFFQVIEDFYNLYFKCKKHICFGSEWFYIERMITEAGQDLKIHVYEIKILSNKKKKRPTTDKITVGNIRRER